jgi:hypothetical protein
VTPEGKEINKVSYQLPQFTTRIVSQLNQKEEESKTESAGLTEGKQMWKFREAEATKFVGKNTENDGTKDKKSSHGFQKGHIECL